MIEKTSAYKTSDGSTHLTIQAAQLYEIDKLGITDCESILKNKDALLSILKLKPRKARKPKAVKAAKTPKAAKTGDDQ